MQYAKAIYRGGMIFNADDGNYNQSRDLGLKCPFCGQAVFWRQGSKTTRRGKTVHVRSSFCHYGSKDEGQECELRSTRKEGQAYVSKLNTVARHQRLRLYNEHLWEMFVVGLEEASPVVRGRVKQICKRVQEAFGKRWVEEAVRDAQGFLLDHLEDSCKMLEEHYLRERNLSLSPGSGVKREEDSAPAKLLAAMNSAYTIEMSDADLQMQILILREILEFVSTKTGAYSFSKILCWHLWFLCLAHQKASLTVENPIFRKDLVEPLVAISVFANGVKEVVNMNRSVHLSGVPVHLAGINWVKACYRESTAKALQSN
jgi:hypothetical protein